MAEQGDKPKPKPKEDEIVAKLVPDPNQPPEPVVLSAFLGKSSEEGSTRLYLDPQLSSYIEVPDDAILHVLKVEQPLGGAYVWVAPEAEVVCGKVGPNRPRAKLMEALMYSYYPAPYYAQAWSPCFCFCGGAPQASPCFCFCGGAPQASPCFCFCGGVPQQSPCFCFCGGLPQQASPCFCGGVQQASPCFCFCGGTPAGPMPT